MNFFLFRSNEVLSEFYNPEMETRRGARCVLTHGDDHMIRLQVRVGHSWNFSMKMFLGVEVKLQVRHPLCTLRKPGGYHAGSSRTLTVII